MLDSDDTAIQKWLAAKEKLGEPNEAKDNDYDAPLLDNKPTVSEPRDVADLDDLDHDEGERRDYLAPLPVLGEGKGSYASSSAGTPPARRRRTRRVKSVSCPTPGSLFGENFPIDEVYIKAHSQDHVETMEMAVEVSDIVNTPADEEAGGVGATTTTTLRRRRHKTVSCPPHMLFLEAERHMNANYFFG